jgi:hypothetical protein
MSRDEINEIVQSCLSKYSKKSQEMVVMMDLLWLGMFLYREKIPRPNYFALTEFIKRRIENQYGIELGMVRVHLLDMAPNDPKRLMKKRRFHSRLDANPLVRVFTDENIVDEVDYESGCLRRSRWGNHHKPVNFCNQLEKIIEGTAPFEYYAIFSGGEVMLEAVGLLPEESTFYVTLPGMDEGLIKACSCPTLTVDDFFVSKQERVG